MDKQLLWGKQDVTFNNNYIFEGKGSHYLHSQKVCVPVPDFMNGDYINEWPKVTQLVGACMSPSSVSFLTRVYVFYYSKFLFLLDTGQT